MNNRIEYNDQGTTTKRGQIAIPGFNGKNNIVNEGVKNAYIANNDIYVYQNDFFAFGTENLTPVSTWSGNVFENNNIYLCGLNATAYSIEKERMQTVNNNTIYSASGNYFKGNEDGSTYNSLTSWRSATGFDIGSSTAASTTCGSGNSTTWYRLENDGQDYWLQASGSNSNVYTASQSSTGDYTRWKKVSASGSWFYLENKGSGQRLKDRPTMVGTSNTGNNVQWQEVDAGNGYQRLQNRASGKWLQASGGNNGTYMTGTSSTGAWTKWKFRAANTNNARVATHQPDRLEAEEYVGNAVQAYPNPASSYLTIQLSAADESALVVLKDMQGRTLVQQQLKSNKSLNTSTLSEGLYLIEIHTAKYNETRKILINR